MAKDIEEVNNNGIVKVKQNGIEYTIWTHAKVVRGYIKDELKKRFPGKLIIREFNKIDLSIPEDNLPVEIQATNLNDRNITYSQWEDKIRRQIEQNIINSGKCLFFFDSELLRAMKNACRRISINMDWFRKYMKEEKLRVFTVSYDGDVKEKGYKDFNFLSEISQTCLIAAETDEMVLEKNKMEIFAGAWHKFTQGEIDKFENGLEKYNEENKINGKDKSERRYKFLTGQYDERSKLYGHILAAVGHLARINKVFDGDIVHNSGLSEGIYLCIFESRKYGRKS